jgi:hypothetical protein
MEVRKTRRVGIVQFGFSIGFPNGEIKYFRLLVYVVTNIEILAFGHLGE